MIARTRSALWNPIISKEVHSRMRTWRATILLLGFLAILAAVASSSYRPYAGAAENIDQASRLSDAGRSVFTALIATVIALIALLAPGLVAGTISGERERQTLDLLLLTRVRPARIVLGKLCGALLFVLLLLLAAVPVFSIVFLLGGIEPGIVVIFFVVTILTAVLLGSLGMVVSACMRRAGPAALSAYVITAVVFVAPVIANTVSPQSPPSVANSSITDNGGDFASPDAQPAPGPTQVVGAGSRWVAAISPYQVVSDTLKAIDAPDTCAYGVTTGGCTRFVSDMVPAGGWFASWREWQVFLVVGTLLASLALGISVMVVRGRVPRPRLPNWMYET